MAATHKIETGEYQGGDFRNPPNELIQLSIAISLKRIADQLSLSYQSPKSDPWKYR